MRIFLYPICMILPPTVFLLMWVSTNPNLWVSANSIAVEVVGNESALQEDQLQQNQSQDIDPESFKISVDASLVATDITIIGKDVPQLSADDFIVLDNGAQQQVTHFSRNELPLAAALLIDTSLTVQDYLALIQIAAGSFLRNLDPEDLVVLFSFDAAPKRLSDLTYDRILIAQKIRRFKFQLGTDLFGAIYDAAEYLQKNARDHRRAIVVISDNYHYGVNQQDARGIAESQRARNKALESAATIYSIKSPSSDMDRMGSLPRMKQIAADTGGEILDTKSWESLQVTLSEVIAKLRMQYVLGFNPSDPGESGSFHTLAVSFADKDRCPNCRLLARSGYYAGASAPPSMRIDVPIKSERSIEETNQLLIQYSIAAVGSVNLDLSDLPFKVSTTQLDGSSGKPHIKVDLNIDSSRIHFHAAQNRYLCKLHVTIFYTNRGGKILGSQWRTIEGELKEDTYQQALENGIFYSTAIPLETEKQMLNVVVYDEKSDRVGSKLIKLP